MSRKLDELNTGIEGLDDGLRELFEICEDKEKLTIIKQAIADKDISREEFEKVVPEILITFSLYLSGPQFEFLLRQINEEAVVLVQEAKSLIEKHFSNIFENEIAKSMLDSVITEEDREHSDTLGDETIRGAEYHLLWENDPPELTPAVRIAFKNQKAKVLLNTRLDWEDFSFLLSNLAEIFVDLLEKGKTLAELGQIDLSYSQKVSKDIEETLVNLQKMKEIMPVYQARGEADKNEQSEKDSSSQK